MMKWFSLALLVAGSIGGVGGCRTPNSACGCGAEVKRYRSTEFYADGKFSQEKAKQAYFELMERFGLPAPESFKADTMADGKTPYFWVTDFAQGDFAAIGMGGVIYVNEKAEGYFNHDIFLLPFQSICEHRHLKTVDRETGRPIPCKIESWLVRKGSIYGFSEIGEPNLDKFPEVKARLAKSQLPYLKSVHVEKWTADGRARKLAGPETWHFMMAGPEGAIVNEVATFHDGKGLRFSIPSAVF
ncbi:MAG: hypothetical protein J6Z49_01855 [Kiritimatiellae bacterium]|nr:hypothetical protein [Kiritimatiellia bacterium]